MEDLNRQASPDVQAMDLRINRPTPASSSTSTSRSLENSDKNVLPRKVHTDKQRKSHRPVNIFKKHKLKYQYLHKRHKLEKSKQASDSGQFGSGSMQGSSSNSKRSNDSTSSLYTSSSPSSGASESPLNLISGENQNTESSGQPMCMMLRHAVPLVVMMQGQLQSTSQSSGVTYSDTTVFKCNMCSMFSNNLSDVLNHVNTNHSSIHYCFVCNQFHHSKHDYERHKSICETAHQAFQQIVDSHYQGSRQGQTSGSQEQALNLSVAGNVAMRAAQIIHNKKGRQNKISKLQKCTYCKKAFFGRFYLQRHLRSHTGEKLCHCEICGKGFAEWRNLRNHMSRFHNSSQSSESGGQSKSVSPNMTSDSDNISSANTPKIASLLNNASNSNCETKSRADVPVDPSAHTTEFNPYQRQSSSKSAEFPHPDELIPAWSSVPQNTEYQSASTCSNTGARSTLPSPSYASSINSESNSSALYSDANQNKSILPDIKPIAAAANLGHTSSRLQLSNSKNLEQSLHPVCTENGEKFFQCSMCNKKFRTKFAMQRHLDFHADKRPYQCEQCDYKAKTKPQLKVHVMRHSGEKGFHCKICNYACVTHSDLNRHCKSRSHLFRVSVLGQKDQASTSSTATVTHTSNDSQSSTHPQNTDQSNSDSFSSK